MREGNRESWQKEKKLRLADLFNRRPVIITATIFSILVFDHLTKLLFASSCNSGIAFGILQSTRYSSFVVPFLFIALASFYLLRQKESMLVFLLSLVVGGGVSNFIDRLIFGCVRDFIDFKIWPSFNLADSAVTVGVLILILAILTKREAKKSNDLNH